MDDFKIPIPTTSRVRFERHRCASRPRLPDSLKPTPTLTPTPIVCLTTARVAGLLSPSDLQDRQRLDELQSNLRTHSEHKKKVFNYLVTVKSKRQEEEGGEFDISEGDVTENAIAGNMLDVLDTLDELLSGADQRLMENGAKAKGPRSLAGALEPLIKGNMETVTDEYGEMVGDIKIRNPLPESLQNKMEEERTSRSEHGVSVKRIKLPAWKAMMDEETPPGSPFSRDLFAKDHIEGEPVMSLVPDHLVKNDEEVKAKAGPFEPRMTSSAAVKAMFERFLGPSKAVETDRLARAEGKAQQKVEKATEKGGDWAPPVPPRIVRRRQRKQIEDGAREAQAVVMESQHAQKRGSPTHRGRERSVSEFTKTTPPMIPLEESDYDYYHEILHLGVKARPGKPPSPLPTMCSDPTLRKARSWSGSSSLPGLELADYSLYVEPNTSTASSVISRNGSEDIQADTSASSVPSTGSQPEKISPVAAMMLKAEFNVTGSDRERYKSTINPATLNASRKAGVAFSEMETFQGILRKGEQAVRDEAGRNSKRQSATSEDDISMDNQVEIENVKPYTLLRRKDPFITPKKNVFERDEDGGSVYSRPTGFTNTQGFRRMDSLEDEEDHRDVSPGSPSLRRTQQIRRGSRRTSRTSVPNSAAGRNSAGWEEAMKTSPASTSSLTSRVPKELRMLGLTMEELFLDPISGDFIEPDRSIGGTAELRRKYEIEGREAWKHGELSVVTLQNVLKEREKERSLTEAMFSDSAKRMPPPKSKLPRGGKKSSRTGIHRQHSTPASIASTLFSLSRKASETSVSSFQPPKKRVPTPSLASNETDRTSGISAGMRRIFAGSFGSKSSDSVMSKRSIDKSMICVIGGRTLSGEVKPPSMMSDGASGESLLPAASITSIQSTSAASVTSSTRSSMTKSICGSVGPIFSRQSSTAAASYEKDENKTAIPTLAKIEPRKLPSPPPKLARHATAPYGNTIKAPITRTEAKERKANVFDFPMPPNVDHYACSLNESGSVPAVQLSPPVTAAAKLFGYNPHHNPTPSRLPTPAHPVALKRPQTGAGSRPMSRANSRAGSRSNSRLSQRTISRNSLTGSGRRGSVSSIHTINRPTSRAASRAGAISRAGATSRVGGITRQKGVANLRTLENRQHRPQVSAAPKMGALLGGESAGSRAGSRLGSYGDERAASRIGSMVPPPKVAPFIRPASRSTGSGFSRLLTKSDRAQATSKLGSYHDSRDQFQTSASADNDQAESGDHISREWLTRDIPLGSRLPAPHLMSSPGGRYPKPMGTMVGGGRNGKRGPGLFSGSGRSSPAVQKVGRGREDGDAQGRQHGKNGNGKRGGDA